MKSIPEVSRVLLIPEFDLLAQFDYPNIKDRERQIREAGLKIRKIAHVMNTRIITLVESASEEASESMDTFTVIRVQPGTMRQVLTRLKELPDIKAAHALLDETDLFIQARSDGLIEIATIIRNKIGTIKWVSDVEALIPHLELNQYALPLANLSFPKVSGS